jgi:hypothetical protein
MKRRAVITDLGVILSILFGFPLRCRSEVVLTVENLTYQARAQQAACGDYIHPCVVTTENPAESPHVVTSMLERQAMTAIERWTKDIKDIIGVTPGSPSQP